MEVYKQYIAPLICEATNLIMNAMNLVIHAHSPAHVTIIIAKYSNKF